MPVLAVKSSCGIDLRAMAWVVAHDPPGCYRSGCLEARSVRISDGAPATPADVI